MACLPNVNGAFEALPRNSKLPNVQKTQKNAKAVGFLSKKTETSQEHPTKTTRRVALSLASIALTAISGAGISFAKVSVPENNGLWYIDTLPVPSVDNKIANEKTGTRSFLKKGIYMANVGLKGTEYRVKKYAFDLLALEDLIGKDTLNYVRKYLRIKSTFMYYDFDKLISAAPVNEKQPLTDLANRLFDSFEKLEDATKMNNLPQTNLCYRDTSAILQEVMNRMA